MSFENYTIKEFIDAMFAGKRDVISEEELGIVYSEYIDVAGLYDLDEFNRVAYIQFLNNRINSIRMAIELQRTFLVEFSLPYKPNFSFFKKYGYTLEWHGHPIDFLMQLKDVEQRERKHIAKLEIKMKELIDERKKKNTKETTTKEKRGNFIRTLNSLGKVGYKIDNFRTTVEELAYMVKEQMEQ